MSCNDCDGCVNTHPMNLCMISLTMNDLPPSVDIELTFESLADGAILIADSTSDGAGVLTITTIPSFIAGVTYKMTASETWGGGSCAFVQFRYFQGPSGIITGTENTITPCN